MTGPEETTEIAAPLPGTGRVEAFSDGVFAIAITLLVLEIHVPDARDGLLAALAREWPQFAAYLTAFATIGAVWLNHHAAFLRIARVDRTLLSWNLVLLLGTSFIPFPTALVAEHLGDGLFSEGARVATAAYGLVGVLVCGSWLAMYRHLVRRPDLLTPSTAVRDVRDDSRRGRVGLLGFALSVAVGILAPPVAVALFLVGSVFYAVTGVPLERGARTVSRAGTSGTPSPPA